MVSVNFNRTKFSMYTFFKPVSTVPAWIFLLFLAPVWSSSRAQESDVYRVQSQFHYNFAKNIHRVETGEDQFAVGVLGGARVLKPLAAPDGVLDVQTSSVRISFDEESMKLIMIFSDDPGPESNCVIDLSRLTDLEYKTRVMRYFAGLLKNQTHSFKTLCLVQGEERSEMPFTRENVSNVVNALCASASQRL